MPGKRSERDQEREAWEAVWAEDAAAPKEWPEASQATPGKFKGRSMEGVTIDPDLRIDLDSEDAIMKLDEIHAWVESRRPPSDDPREGDEPPITPEDEAELEAIHARLDRAKEKKKRDWAHDIGGWLMKSFAERAHELVGLYKAGYKKAEVRRIAGTLAEEMSEEFEELMEIRRKDGGTRGSRIPKEDFLQKLLELAEEGR